MVRVPTLAAVLLLIPVTLFAVPTPVPPTPGEEPPLPSWAASIQAIIARKGAMQPGEVFRVGIPRTDLRVVRDKTPLEPVLATTSWEAYRRIGKGNDVMVMGDLVLLTAEVDPVMKRLFQGGMRVTALHNHLRGETPRLLFMHYEGTGLPSELAITLREALALTATPRYESPTELLDVESHPSPEILKAYEQVQQILGQPGKLVRKVLQVSFPRAEPVRCGTMELPPSMGTATQINFQPAEGGLAATGDFVLIDDELEPVLQALVRGGISVEAIHSHMIHEEPTLKFVHFWAQDSAEKVATALRAALDQVAIKRQPPSK